MRFNRRNFIQSAIFASSAVRFRALAEMSDHLSSAAEQLSAQHQIVPAESLRSQFREPAKKFRPMVRWWWPGNDVTEAELRREVAALDEAGFGSAEIQAFFKGLNPDDLSNSQKDRINSYATESFFRHVAFTAKEARERGLFIDYTFGSGWPFGGGDAITPELSAIELRSSHLSVQGPTTFHGHLHLPSVLDGDPMGRPDALGGLSADWLERMKKRTKLVAVVAVRGSDAEWDFYQAAPRGRSVRRPGKLVATSSVDLTAHLEPNGVLRWNAPEGTWQVFVFCSVPTGQRVNGAAGNGPQLVLDHLSAEAFRAHAKRVGDAAVPYLKDVLGNGMRAVFCDSLEVRANLYWSDDFLAEFKQRRRYDLQPYLPILQVQSFAEPFDQFLDVPMFEMEGVGPRVRHDYQLTISELMAERFYGEFNRWAHDHNLLSRTQAHGAPVDVLQVYGEADIPETEHLYDAGCYDFLKLASSAAHVNGRAIVGSESFVWPGALYQTTPEKMKLAADELFTAGVNAIVCHGFAYRMPGLSAPGWHPFTGINHSGNYSSQFNEQNPLWIHFAQLNQYIARLQYILQTGKIVAAVALYRDALTHGAEERSPTPLLNQAIMDAGYHYDHINEGSLLDSKVENKQLVTPGGTRYRALVFPSTDFISPLLAETIETFALGGLPVFFTGNLPTRSNGFTVSDEDTRRVQRAAGRIRQRPNCYAARDTNDLVSRMETQATPNIRFHGRSFPFIQKACDRNTVFLLRNSSDEAQFLDAEFEAEGQPELWDPWTGKMALIAHDAKDKTRTLVQLALPPLSSALIVFCPMEDSMNEVKHNREDKLAKTEEVGVGGWTLTATGMTPFSENVTLRRTLSSLIDWALDDDLRGFSGRGVYRTEFTLAADVRYKRVILDLGLVREVAEVKINDKPAGTLLLRPYEIDVTDLVNPGENALEVAVTNTLFNAMTLRTQRAFSPGPTENSSGLMSGGLIGPVQMKFIR